MCVFVCVCVCVCVCVWHVCVLAKEPQVKLVFGHIWSQGGRDSGAVCLPWTSWEPGEGRREGEKKVGEGGEGRGRGRGRGSSCVNTHTHAHIYT